MPKNKRSKKLKAKWRKTDISDITDAKMRETVEQLKGGPLAKRSDSLLFTIDKQPRTLTAAERKEIARTQMTKLEQSIQPNPNVRPTRPGATKRKRVVQPSANPKRRKLNDGSDEKVKEKPKESEDYFDIWSVQPETVPTDIRVSKPLPVKPKPPQRRPSVVPAVEVPHEGASYRPPPEAHKELITMAVKEQLKKRAEYDKVMNALKGENLPRDKKLNDEEEDDEEEEQEEKQPVHVNLPHIPRKTRTQRNKERRKARARRMMAKKRYLEKLRKVDVDTTAKEVLQETEKTELESAIRKKKREDLIKNRVKRLGPEKFEQPDISVALSNQLVHTMRHISTHSNPLVDRFVSFQKRNIIEARSTKNYHRRYLLKAKNKRHIREYIEAQTNKYSNVIQ